MEAKGNRTEFKVVLEGVDLSEEHERSIRQGIQSVVTSHLAEVDFGGDRVAGILGLIGEHGHTQGIFWRPEPGPEVEEVMRSFQER